MAPARRLRTLIAMAAVGATLVLVAPMPASAASTVIALDPVEPFMTTYETRHIKGTVTPATASPTVFLQWEVDGVWKDIDSAHVSSGNGRYDLSIYPHVRGDYHLRVRSQHGSVTSPDFVLTAKPHTTELRAYASPNAVGAGQQTTVYGNVIEPGATPRVVVQRKVGNGWSDRQSGAVNPKTGRFEVAIVPSEGGLYTLRVRTAGGSRWSEPFSVSVSPRPMP